MRSRISGNASPAQVVRRTVARVSNLLYRRPSSLLTVRQFEGVVQFAKPADWKSAIQQVGNPRYFDSSSAGPGTARPTLRALLFCATLALAEIIGSFQAGAALQGCIVIERQGKVEFARKGSAQWSLAQSNEVLQVGDRLRTGFRSRATLRWSELAVIRVDELTSMEIQPPAKPGAKPEMDLKSGATYFFSRERPEDIQFHTPVASGAIRGTEFNLKAAEDGRTELSLLHGEVAVENPQGSTTLKSGEQSVIAPGRAPTRAPLVEAVNVIQWVLYYPIVVDADELFGVAASEKQPLTDSLEAYRKGDLRAALEKYPENRAPASDSEKLYHAALQLAAGKPDQTEAEVQKVGTANPVSNALREIIAAVKHQQIPTPQPTTASEWMARSYYEQSRGNLVKARQAAMEATAKSPSFGPAWIRRAELEFGFGHVDAAREALNKGLELSPRDAQGLALNGFILSAGNHSMAAMASFDKAIAVDGALPDAWLGRGLVKIRTNHRWLKFLPELYAEGLSDLETAAALAPQRSVLRSYLGKAFSDAYDPRRARKELDLAIELDPNDPTGWLYLALLNEQENRINEAVTDLEKSKELNDNREIFRSRLLLDQDEAVRGANLAAIYRDAGMFDRSAQEAARAVNNDYGNYSAHLFLANSYDTLRDPKLINLRYETPWFSELLLANLLSPVGGGNLSQNISQQEYSRFFVSDGLGVFSSTEYRSRGDWLENASQYGQFGNFGYSLDAFYRSENGFRPNNDLEQLNLALRIKQQITEKDSVFFQAGYFDSESGDLNQYYNQTNASTTFRAMEKQEPSLLVGYHREWSPGNHTLLLLSRIDDKLTLNDSGANPLARTTYTFIDLGGNTVTNDFLWNPNGTTLHYFSELQAYSAELQQIWETPCQTLVVGGRYQAAWADTTDSLFRPGSGPFGVPIDVSQSLDNELDRFSVYGYENWRVCDALRLIGGVSYDRLHYPRNIDVSPLTPDETTTDQVSPKGGILLTPWKDGNFRADYSQSLGGVFFDQSVRLEPVQLAGFNQAFRSAIPESVAGLVPATRFETWGGGYDQRIKATGTYLLFQGEFLNSDATRTIGILTNDVTSADPLTPGSPSSTRQTLHFEETSFIATVNQLIARDLSLGARYKMTEADYKTRSLDIPGTVAGASALNQDVSATLHQVWLYAIYQHPSGFFAQFDTVWSQQSNRGYSPDIPGDDFWQFNLSGGYRFLQRRAEVRVGLLNIGNRDYKLNPLTLYNELPRERTLLVSLKLDF